MVYERKALQQFYNTSSTVTIFRVIIHALIKQYQQLRITTIGPGKTFTAFSRLFACFFTLITFNFHNLKPVIESHIVHHSVPSCLSIHNITRHQMHLPQQSLWLLRCLATITYILMV